MKKTSIIIISLLLLIGCSAGYQETSMTVRVVDAPLSRTISPSMEDVTVASYMIHAEYLDCPGVVVTKEFGPGEISIPGFYAGTWNMRVEGFNAKHVPIASSPLEKVRLTKNYGENRHTFRLDWLKEGKGTLAIDLESYEHPFDLKVYAVNAQTKESFTSTFPMQDSGCTFPCILHHEMQLAPGSYELKLQVEQRGFAIWESFIESVDINANVTSTISTSWYRGFGRTQLPVPVNSNGGSLSAFIGEKISVDFECNEDSRVYYTLDGSEPDEHSTLYTGSFILSDSTVIKAVAYSDDRIPSRISTTNVDFTLPKPEFVVTEDPSTHYKTVEIRSNVPGATIRYALGKLYDAPSYRFRDWSIVPCYEKPLVFANDMNIVARVFLDGYEPSETVAYDLKSSVPDPGIKAFLNIPEVDWDREERLWCVWVSDGHDYDANIEVTGNASALPVSVKWVYTGIPVAGVDSTVLKIGRSAASNVMAQSGYTWVSAEVHVGPYIYIVHYDHDGSGLEYGKTYTTFVNGY